MNNRLLVVLVGTLAVVSVAMFLNRDGSTNNLAAAGGAFDEYGYNIKARIFNGTGGSWCIAGGQASTCMGIYSPDKLVMKWTAGWERGNEENWAKPPYKDAWIDNEWNGKASKNGSGAVWHYKIKWVGWNCGPDGTPLPDGSTCLWGQFATIMDQGVDPSYGPGHTWFAKAIPNGYGTGKN